MLRNDRKYAEIGEIKVLRVGENQKEKSFVNKIRWHFFKISNQPLTWAELGLRIQARN